MHSFEVIQVSLRVESLGLWVKVWVSVHTIHGGNKSSVLLDEVAINHHYQRHKYYISFLISNHNETYHLHLYSVERQKVL